MESRKLSDVEFVAFDLETTGLFPISCRIVEFGAVRFCIDGRELDRFERIVDPGCVIPPSVSKIHGITNEMVDGQPTVDQVLPEFLEFLGNADSILMAHNATFDLGFLTVALAQSGLDSPTHPVLDTLDFSRQRQRRLANHRLETLAIHLGVADEEGHRALSDSLVLKSVFLNLIDRSPRPVIVSELFDLSPPLAFDDSEVFLMQPPPGFEELSAAMAEGHPITMVYEGGTKGLAHRTVTPRGLVQSRGKPYLAAYCHIDRKDKMYRLDRIREFRVIDE